MAAADYFAAGTRPSATYLSPPQPHRASSQPNMNFNQPPPPQFSNSPSHPSPLSQPTTPHYHPPPPYGDEPKPNVHFAPPPVELHAGGRHSFSGARPNPPYFPPPPSQLSPYRPQTHAQPTHLRPYTHPNSSTSSSLTSGYSSDPEPHRHRRRHSKDKKARRISESSRSRSTVADGFIGAASGGLIGDLIFPGLGTAAGAVAGWLGGKDYGEHRKARELKREREEDAWQRKYGVGSRSRDGSYDGGRRAGRGHSKERRRSQDYNREPPRRRRSADYGVVDGSGRRRSHDGRRGVEY